MQQSPHSRSHQRSLRQPTQTREMGSPHILTSRPCILLGRCLRPPGRSPSLRPPRFRKEARIITALTAVERHLLQPQRIELSVCFQDCSVAHAVRNDRGAHLLLPLPAKRVSPAERMAWQRSGPGIAWRRVAFRSLISGSRARASVGNGTTKVSAIRPFDIGDR
jgi:hypothetical protein